MKRRRTSEHENPQELCLGLPAHELGAKQPTPDPSQEGNWPAGVAPLLGGAGGEFRGRMRAQNSAKCLLGERAGVKAILSSDLIFGVGGSLAQSEIRNRFSSERMSLVTSAATG